MVVFAGGRVTESGGRALGAAVRRLLEVGEGRRIEMRMPQVESVSLEAWAEILAASLECQERGVGLTAAGMSVEVRGELGRIWNAVVARVETAYRMARRKRGAGAGGRVVDRISLRGA